MNAAAETTPPPAPRPAGPRARLMRAARWAVALLGIAYIVGTTSLRDRVALLAPDGRTTTRVPLLAPAADADATFVIRDPATGQPARVPRERVIAPAARSSDSVAPLIERGLVHMVAAARPWPLVGAVIVYAVSVLLGAARWHALMATLGVRIARGRALVLNQVGAFYNNFMPGSTGGDVMKAYYASRHTPWRTRAVMSVLVDRAIGLLALVGLGGAVATWQVLSTSRALQDPDVGRVCRQVALFAAVAFGGLVAGLVAFYNPAVRRLVRLDALLARMPLQKQVRNAVQALHDYGHRPGVVLAALAVSVPVHAAVVVSAMLAGRAFGLPLAAADYFVIVPVIVLAGVLPLAPQGVGVMEFVAVVLTRPHGATPAQGVALAMAVRLVPVAWSLLGGFFLLRGACESELIPTNHPNPAAPPARPTADDSHPIPAAAVRRLELS